MEVFRAAAVVSHGSVWAIAATEVNHRTGSFWVEIDLKTLKLAQHGTVGDPNADVVFASLNVDGNGSLGIAMNHMSATEYSSVYVTGRLASDPPNTLRPLVKAVEGRHVFVPYGWDLSQPGTGTGYMDYSTVVVDPADPTLFWTNQEVATNECCRWRQAAGSSAPRSWRSASARRRRAPSDTVPVGPVFGRAGPLLRTARRAEAVCHRIQPKRL